MNRGELEKAVQDYTHRSDQGVNFNTWFALVEARIWAQLKAAANEQTGIVSIHGAAAAVPPEYRNMRLVNSLATGKPLVWHPPALLSALPTAGTVASFWAVAAGEFDVRARVDGDYALTFWGSLPALVGAGDENAVSTQHPQIYLDGLLSEAFKWERDVEAATEMANVFDGGIESLNDRSNADRW